MDEGFWTKAEREELKRRIQAIGAKAVMYYIDTPIETIREYLTESKAEVDNIVNQARATGALISDEPR